MNSTQRDLVSDLRGASRIAVDATKAITDLVEAMHGNVSPLQWRGGTTAPDAAQASVTGSPVETSPPAARNGANRRTGGLTGLIYRSVRGTTRLVGAGIDLALAQLSPLVASSESSPGREAMLAALNGVIGDYLAATGNSLAITMSVRRKGFALTLERDRLADALPQTSTRLLLWIHGLCMNDLQWVRNGADFGEALAREQGWTSLALHYNSGLHVSDNGQQLSALLERLVGQWPGPLHELAIVGHSMGGLLARSALAQAHTAGLTWPVKLRRMVFLGTPHHGAPLERGGHRLDVLLSLSPYVAPFTRLGRVRSAGIRDLRYGSLLQADWSAYDSATGPDRRARDPRTPLPLPENVECFTVAAMTAERSSSPRARLIGDGLVPLDSALGIHQDPRMTLAFDERRRWIGRAMGHLELQTRPEVLDRLRCWLAPEGPGAASVSR